MSASKFTHEVRSGLYKRIAAGVSTRDEAQAVGVREKTVKDWLTRGRRDPEGAYGEFARAIDEARQDAQENQGAMTREEFDVHLAKAFRRGSVTAMKLWAEFNISSEPPEPEPDEFDQIKASRARV